MISSQFYATLKRNFPFTATSNQDIFFQKIAIFATNYDNDEVFVLKGYAGTGSSFKTKSWIEQL